MNKTKNYDLTIVVPVYNEEDNMERVEAELGRYVASAPVKTCVLFVNDGSRDSSLQKIKEACARHAATRCASSAVSTRASKATNS